MSNHKTLTKIILAGLLMASCNLTPVFAQNKKGAVSEKQDPQRFFSKPDLMQIGVYYYPEQWPREQWERDLKNIKKLGFEFTHFAEFAWTFMEPEEGKYDFKWLDDALAIAEKQGLKVIMCTPTPTPPAWMAEKYPEIYLVDASGRRREHGNRANQSVSNEKYREFVTKIVTELGKRYGNNKNVIGWQVDNEPGAPDDFSPSAQKGFQKWLKAKYGTIEKLNAEWVASFWSIRYNNFEQIAIPNAEIYFEDKLSPHAVLDFKRFTADSQAEYLNLQAEILRKYIDPEQWITTNYTNVVYGADPRRTDKMDFATYTMYPVSGRNNLGGQNFRMGHPNKISEANDYYRSINGVTGVMEMQPGQVNWASINPQLLPGTVHMWISQAFGGGCSFTCTYRYRHPLGSSEMYHDGIVGTDGVTLTTGGKEFVQSIEDMKLLRKEYNPKAVIPQEIVKRKTGFLWSHDNLWDLENQKQTQFWSTWRHRNIYTSAVKSTGAPMDFITEESDFSDYAFIVAPAYQLIDQKLVGKWTKYVENGGNLILSCRTGQKDKNGHFFEANWSGPIVPLIGADVEFFDMLVEDVNGTINVGNNTYKWNVWADVLNPKQGTEVLASYADQFYKGKAAAITRKLGKGTVTYIGAESKEGNLERQVVRTVYERAKVAIEDFPKGVYVEWRDGFYVGVNYTNETINMPIPAGSKILVGKNPLEPAQAVIWK
ncbi:beta-galactosidase [Flavobacterium sp. HBTb2-11-1]|uniref:beta-galactosidase n=1 Tax=Flavobacterium sp. HBTb2-11-1 TaxID=2692212 RepID=UPI00136DAC2C|nr:beta-galactosidase [Flavobacterium sp. HBTb2-11-1]MXO04915.1 beta-galactosidase [Flavobacterium sp. HBTb2-11-1]